VSKPAILLVDNNADFVRMLSLALIAEGYSTREAPDGRRALVEFRRDPAQVLITDLFMPEMDGFELIAMVRRESPAAKIIAVSGDAIRAKRDYLGDASLAGADAILRKPFTVPALLAAIRGL
jgi:two-component system chemotaxis response regulator CheY